MAKRKRHRSTADSVIESQLDTHIQALESEVNGDVVAVSAPIEFGVDDFIRESIEFRCGARQSRKKKLAVILETSGGYIEVAQRIVQVFRTHYREVDFIVPNYAMSAGTVLALSGDAIFMDYYSILGPIDPQIRRQDDQAMLPALGYLKIYNRLIDKANNGKITSAEVTYLVQRFNPAELYRFEQAVQLSVSLLKEWLVKYKFKNWKVTKKRRRHVTPRMRRETAIGIAEMLNDTSEWHSHGRGISMGVLRKRVGLEIDDFGKKPSLNQAIRTYYELLSHYMMRRGQSGVIHVAGKYTPLFFGQ